MKSIRTLTEKILPEKHDIRNISTGTKLRFHFNITDETNKQHKHDLAYFSRCPSTTCTDSNIEETARYLSELVGITLVETQSRIPVHNLSISVNKSDHETVNNEYFKILNIFNNTFRKIIFEELFAKLYHPSFNVQDNSVPLELFN